MQLILEHTTTKFKRYYPEVEVKIDNPLYITIEVNTSSLADGEYEMKLYTNDNKIVAEDIVKIGDYKTPTTEYKIEKKFTQYVRK